VIEAATYAIPTAPDRWATTPFRRFVADFADSKLALVGLVGFAMFAFLALFGPFIAPQDPYDLAQLDIFDMRLAPGAVSQATGMTYWLGTDNQGRDMLSAIIYGLRVSLFVGASSAVVSLALGAALGLVAAYFGGKVDSFIMRVVDIQLSFPAILVALILLSVLGQGVDKVLIALIIVQWAYYARTARGSALVERNKDYVGAAECLAVIWGLVAVKLAAFNENVQELPGMEGYFTAS